MSASKTQIDLLGNRLKEGSHTESDLRLLDHYRRSFGEAYEAVVQTICRHGEFPTGRLAKSTVSIVEKLRRESIRLSQMQDIAGCRIVVDNVLAQEKLVASLRKEFPEASVIDRRDHPSYGYRAIHIIVKILGKPVEIQVRSLLQHLWAEVSEKSSDVLDPAIKYGGGPDSWRKFLIQSSESVVVCEAAEKACYKTIASQRAASVILDDLNKAVATTHLLPKSNNQEQDMREQLENSIRDITCAGQQIDDLQKKLLLAKNENIDLFTRAIAWLDKQKRLAP